MVLRGLSLDGMSLRDMDLFYRYLPTKNEISREVMKISKVEWDDLWLSTNHLLADIIDTLQWNIYAIYKSQAGKGSIPKPKPIKRPQYTEPEKPVQERKPRSLRDLHGMMGQKIIDTKPE